MRKANKVSNDMINYNQLVTDLKAILDVEKIWGQRAANQIKIQITWKIGERIFQEMQHQAEKSSYLMPLYHKLAKDLNLAVHYLAATVKFFRLYPCPQLISGELSWSHYYQLITIEDEKIRRFYELQAIANDWSVRELKKRIQVGEHQKLEKTQIPLPPPLPDIPEIQEVIKNRYNFDFIQLPDAYSESDLERALINQIGKFLLELGSGFFFAGNQYKITIAGNSHYVDLVFFQAHLACYILIDLKIEKFQDMFIGQMNKYLRYFREHINLPYMRPPIGLIICKSVHAEEVYYALEGLEKKIFIAEYQLHLPQKRQLLDALKNPQSNGHFASMRVSARQTKALNKLRGKKEFAMKEYKQVAQVSMATAQRDLQQLISKGVVEKKGIGKKTCYRFI